MSGRVADVLFGCRIPCGWNECNISNRAQLCQQSVSWLSEVRCRTLSDVAKLDPDDTRPPYQQVAHLLRRAIEQGDLKPGEQLPSYQGLADQYGVAIGTVKRAVAIVRDEGLIIVRHGMGSYVRTNAQQEEGVDELAELRQQLADVRERLDAIERRLPAE